MQVVDVDERDSNWEDMQPRFRVYLHKPWGNSVSYSTDAVDLVGFDVLQAIDWAQSRAEGDQWALALVGGNYDDEDRRGLIWLVGMDGNDTPTNDHEAQIKSRMVSRANKRIVVPALDKSPI